MQLASEFKFRTRDRVWHQPKDVPLRELDTVYVTSLCGIEASSLFPPLEIERRIEGEDVDLWTNPCPRCLAVISVQNTASTQVSDR
jgi:hypothetical protein